MCAMFIAGCSSAQHVDTNSAGGASPGPAMFYEMRGYGFVWTDRRFPTEPDGRPHIYRVADIGKDAVPRLDDVMAEQVAHAVRDVRPPYRSHLSFLFADEYGKRYLVVFIDGYPQYPIVNLCYDGGDCHRTCPRYLDPHLRIVRVSTMKSCADKLPIWAARG